MKRFLNKKEIKNIIKYIVNSNDNMEKLIKKSFIKIMTKDMEEQLTQIKIYPEKITELKKELKKIYLKSLIQPGENVGVIMAQSMGERQTQLTLNSFHSAGLAIETVVTGVPRFSELLNATKNPKASYCSVYFNKNNNSVQELRKHINHSIVGLYFKDLYSSFKISRNKMNSSWYQFYEIFNSIDYKNTYCIRYKLNKAIIYKYLIDLELIKTALENNYDEIQCVYSSLNIGIIDVYINITNINTENHQNLFINEDNKYDIFINDVVVGKLDEILVCGIKNIRNIYFKTDPNNLNEWIIHTSGSNFLKLIQNPIVNSVRTITNNIWDIYHILGIEAAREFLIEEFLNIISSDGTYINISHVKLLVDIMCFSGVIKSISRYGIDVNEVGPIAKVSFEESLDNCRLAGIYGLKDNIKGVSSSVLVGKKSKIGTGLVNLKMDLPQLDKN